MFREAKIKSTVYAETCTHYLTNSINDLKGQKGINYICTPPLRIKEDQMKLWKGLFDGTISLVSSDHCAFTSEMKRQQGTSFDQVPHGMPGIEFRVPLVFSEGVVKRKLSLPRFSKIISTNAAKIFGLYPKKGLIGVGCDADLMIIGPNIVKVIGEDEYYYNMDWCPFEGIEVNGWPTITIQNGVPIWNEGSFNDKRGNGKFLKRAFTQPRGV